MSENTKDEARTWTENLPKPPVPSVEETIARYLAGLEPVIPGQQFEQTKQTAEAFLHSGEGERLQKLLTEYAERSDNWVTDFWLDDMYLCNPVPLLVNSNPFFLLPRQTFKDTAEQVHFAAELVRFALLFREQINKQTLSQEVGKGQKRDQKLCMQTYRHFFTACRIPGEFKDDLQILRKSSEHFIVAAFNQFYAVHLDAEKGLPTVEDLAICLHSIWTAAKGAPKEKAPPVGILTTDNRKTWALARKQLLKDANNKRSLEYMEQCLFVLCLDDFVTPRVPTKSGYRNSIQLARMDMSYMASMLLHAGGSTLHTANRWFDKFLQIVVSKEGICGLVIEHSASEGVTVLRFLELFLAHQSAVNNSQGAARQLNRQNSVEMRQRESTIRRTALQWKVDAEVETMIRASEKNADKVIQDLDLYVVKFAEFGSEFIKQQRISPDVFIQLALQLTYFKLHRRVVSTYESCSLRQFRKGRVDNIRSATKEALAWARAMCGESDTAEEKTLLFKRAICKQTEVLKYTASGYGPDNHLVALRELGKSSTGQVGALFREKSYKEFINFRLSTSQLFTPADILIGYGPVVSDGYGCCYMPKGGCIYFVISSFYSSAETSSDFFASSLESSLLQMRELCQKMNETEHDK